MNVARGPAPPLKRRELHVWRVDLDLPAAALERLAQHLSAEEQRRQARFVREADRRRFLVAHAAVRTILGKYLGVAPASVEIAARADGKPELALSPDRPPLYFNLSHSEGLALVAVASDRAVGVDVEYIRPMVEMENIVRRHFAPNERAAWLALPKCERPAAFFRCWTRKEAYLKARGVGLAGGLDRFEVSLAPAESLTLLPDTGLVHAGVQWRLYDFSPAADYAAACAVEGAVESISTYNWP